MSILIKGMEMPKEDGALCIIIHHDGKVCHFFDLQGERIATAVPVPEHGDLIDRSALQIELMDRGIEGLQTDDWHEIQQALSDAPTIIPASKEDGE